MGMGAATEEYRNPGSRLMILRFKGLLLRRPGPVEVGTRTQRIGRHRHRWLPELIIAATAEVHRGTVLHDDGFGRGR